MSKKDAKQLSDARILAGARAYAEFDKSDPFTLARALCHIRQGLCGAVTEGPDKGGAGHYEATRINDHTWVSVSRT